MVTEYEPEIFYYNIRTPVLSVVMLSFVMFVVYKTLIALIFYN